MYYSNCVIILIVCMHVCMLACLCASLRTPLAMLSTHLGASLAICNGTSPEETLTECGALCEDISAMLS